MSVTTVTKGVLAVLQAKKAKEDEVKKLQKAIDADVQKLKGKAEKRMEGVPNDEEYYVIEIDGSEIEYENPGVVIDKFCKMWEGEGFFVPKVKARKGKGTKTYSFTIRFRPTDESIRLAGMLMTNEVPSSGSSNVS